MDCSLLVLFLTLGGDFQCGADYLERDRDGIRNAVGNVVDAVKSIADKIAAFLHFSVPDEGPLTDVEADSGGETEALEAKQTEMYMEGYKLSLVKDTSYKGLWRVSFTLWEF